MSDLLAAQQQRLDIWVELAISQGWLADNAGDTLQQATLATPGQLFDQSNRPLVAGLFGGTGVGKSSLLNRLAGEAVARVSAERPTSRDITVYVHRSISVDHLPQGLPLERMRTALHNNPEFRHVLFIDIPDFDSVEQANRELVDAWLPHLDVVMYVVSPERYRDDQGWQLLQRHAREHAWIFIINQWDRGSPELRDDFIAQLKSQGLTDPVVYCTDCAELTHAPGADVRQATDDFPRLQQSLQSLSNDQIIDALQEHGVLSRLQGMKTVSDCWLQPLGDKADFAAIRESWREQCTRQHKRISDALQWPLQQLAAQYAQHTPFWKKLIRQSRPVRQVETSQLGTTAVALNERLRTQFDDFINQQSSTRKMPVSALQQALFNPFEQVLAQTEQTLQDRLSQALAQPGNAWQRKLYGLLGAACFVLPLASLLWISVRIVSAFVNGGIDTSAYLDSSFAINASLLLGISWLLPAIAHAMLTPSYEEAALLGLREAMADVFERTHEHVDESLQALAEEALQLRRSYQQLWSEMPTDGTAELPEPVRRMLISRISQTPARTLDVRANTHSSTASAPLS